MHTESVAEENRSFAVNPSKVPWLVTEVEAQEGFRLKVRFIDRVEGLVDMSAFIHSPKAGVFSVLADPVLAAVKKRVNPATSAGFEEGADFGPFFVCGWSIRTGGHPR